MGVQKINLSDGSKLVQQNTHGLLVGTEKVMDFGTGTPATEELPVATDTTGQNMKASGAKVETTVEAGTLIKVAVFSADPAAPENGDIWALDSGGNTWLKMRIGGTTKAVQLT